MREKRIITAALPYINNVPHLGHIVGSHLPADIFARYCRARGYQILFVGGTDEHGSTSEIAAAKLGLEIPVFAERLHREHAAIYRWFGISYDNFSRTSKPIHHDTTRRFFEKILDNGHVRKGTMKVFYSPKEDMFLPDRYVIGNCPKCGYERANGEQCEQCTAVLDATQLVAPRSTLSGEAIEIRDSDHLFLQLDHFSQKLRDWIAEQPWRSQVSGLANGWLNDGLKERCITRDLKHGVPVPMPGYEKKVFYVWFDAPIGYISFTREASPDWDEAWKKGEARVYHFLGKDNIPFHTIFWPAMLMAQGEYALPAQVVGLQYLNYEGGKFSKSQGRGVFCEKLPGSGIDPDVIRGYLTNLIPETSDSEFKWEEFQQRVNSDLIGNFGNLVNRSVSFIANKLGGTVARPAPEKLREIDRRLSESMRTRAARVTELLEKTQFRAAYAEILALSADGNKYFDENKPWALVKTDPELACAVLHLCADLCATLAILSAPFTPGASRRIWEQLQLVGRPDEPGRWDEAGRSQLGDRHDCGKPQMLFTKMTDEYLDAFRSAVSGSVEVEELFRPAP